MCHSEMLKPTSYMTTRARHLSNKVADDPTDPVQLIACKIGQRMLFGDFQQKRFLWLDQMASHFFILLKDLRFCTCGFPVGIYLLKVNNRSTRTRCETCSNLSIKTPTRRHWRPSGVFIVSFEHILYLVLDVSIVNFEHAIAGCVGTIVPSLVYIQKKVPDS